MIAGAGRRPRRWTVVVVDVNVEVRVEVGVVEVVEAEMVELVEMVEVR